VALGIAAVVACQPPAPCRADGKLQPPRKYAGSLEEQAQEALMIFKSGDDGTEAVEDLILKIRVTGAAETFAWIIPFPTPPKVKRAEAKLFPELFHYVESRRIRGHAEGFKTKDAKEAKSAAKGGVRVLSREVVGTYDVAVVRETADGALNRWLADNGYRTLENADDVLKFYRDKKYVFACIKVDDTQLHSSKTADLHPLRFTFKTGGRDGIYFPMKLTGLQTEPFFVNLYVLYRYWLNDDLSKFGYVHRGFHLHYRDWDSPQCEANAGKAYSAPQTDPFLKPYAHHFPTLSSLLQASYPGERFYLTNIQAGLNPRDVREWKDDLWLFPYYTNVARVPFDARPGGVASAAWPDQKVDANGNDPDVATWFAGFDLRNPWLMLAAGLLLGALLAGGFFWWRTVAVRRAAKSSS
jgi:Uncharacterized protein conserved in bacteria (DUF2330)